MAALAAYVGVSGYEYGPFTISLVVFFGYRRYLWANQKENSSMPEVFILKFACKWAALSLKSKGVELLSDMRDVRRGALDCVTL